MHSQSSAQDSSWRGVTQVLRWSAAKIGENEGSTEERREKMSVRGFSKGREEEMQIPVLPFPAGVLLDLNKGAEAQFALGDIDAIFLAFRVLTSGSLGFGKL